MKSTIIASAFLFTLILNACKSSENEKLPYLGNPKIEGGKEVKHTIRPFTYLNQDSITVTNDSLANSVYVADFFFVSCPSICPKVARQMLTIYNAFKDDNRVKLVSFTIDPKRDIPAKLRRYAANLEVDTKKWMFLTGEKDFTMELAHDYFVSAMEDSTAPGGFNHSGKIVLIDRQGHVRAFSEGTDPNATPQFIENIRTLLMEDK
jgi:protein SCO1